MLGGAALRDEESPGAAGNLALPRGFNGLAAVRWVLWGQAGAPSLFFTVCGDGFQCLRQVRHSMLLTCPFYCLSILIFSLAVKRGNFLTCFVAFICYRLQSESLVYTSILKKYPYSVLSRQHNEKWD